jgi:hypothetical protein
MKTSHLLLSAFLAVTLFGCKSATRLSIRPEEANYHFIVRHSQGRSEAFNNVELALAGAYNDLPAVLKLKQPQTGTFLLKPLVEYRVGGSFGTVQRARYTLKAVVSDGSITLDFELEREIETGTWPPETEMPKIKATFQTVASDVAKAVNGKLE